MNDQHLIAYNAEGREIASLQLFSDDVENHIVEALSRGAVWIHRETLAERSSRLQACALCARGVPVELGIVRYHRPVIGMKLPCTAPTQIPTVAGSHNGDKSVRTVTRKISTECGLVNIQALFWLTAALAGLGTAAVLVSEICKVVARCQGLG